MSNNRFNNRDISSVSISSSSISKKGSLGRPMSASVRSYGKTNTSGLKSVSSHPGKALISSNMGVTAKTAASSNGFEFSQGASASLHSAKKVTSWNELASAATQHVAYDVDTKSEGRSYKESCAYHESTKGLNPSEQAHLARKRQKLVPTTGDFIDRATLYDNTIYAKVQMNRAND